MYRNWRFSQPIFQLKKSFELMKIYLFYIQPRNRFCVYGI